MTLSNISPSRLGLCGTLATAVSLMAAGPASAAVTALYELDGPDSNAKNGPVIDSAGDNDGSPVNAPAGNQPGVFGTSYDFQSSGPDYVNLGTDEAVRPTGDFSITTWFNMRTVGANDRILGAYDNSNGTTYGRGWQLKNRSDDKILFSGETRPEDPRGRIGANTGVVPEEDQWYFVSVRYDADDVGGNGIDGVDVRVLEGGDSNLTASEVANGPGTSESAHGPFTYNTGNEVNMAHPSSLNANQGSGKNLDGRLDDVAFYDNVLSDEQVAQAYNQGAASLIPEPTSLALLGLGGVTLLGRRRRAARI